MTTEIAEAEKVAGDGKRKEMARGKLAVLHALRNIVDRDIKSKAPYGLGIPDAINDVLQKLGLVDAKQLFWEAGR